MTVGLHVVLAALKSFLGGSDGKRGSNPNPKWRDPGTPEGWYKPDGTRQYAEPGSGSKMGSGIAPPTRPMGKPVDTFIQQRQKVTGPIAAITPQPTTGLISKRQMIR